MALGINRDEWALEGTLDWTEFSEVRNFTLIFQLPKVVDSPLSQ